MEDHQLLKPSRISKILVAVDGSHFAEKAGITAGDLSRKYAAHLTILHVANYPPNELGIDRHTIAVGLPLTDSVVDKVKHEATESMHRIAVFAKSLGISCDQRIINTSSSIVETISDFCYRNEIDLLVVGTHGLSEFKRSLIGSVSEGLVEHSRCNLLIVK